MKYLYLCLILLLFPLAANAQDEGLYDPVAPEGSAFIRFLDLSDGDNQDGKIGRKSYGKLQKRLLSAYYPVEAQEIKISIGIKNAEKEIEEGEYYTAVANDESLSVLKDAKIGDMSKAVINLYNFTSEEEISLVTREKNIAVIETVESGKTNSREVNAMTLNLDIQSDETVLAGIDELTLERRNVSNILLLENDNGYETTVSKSKTDTTK